MKLNPEQDKAVNYGEGPLLIIAGAGSGKTKTLTSRVIQLLKGGARPETIVALTFTNKAAEEMRSRISDAKETRIHANDANNFSRNSRGLALSSRRLSEPFIGTFHSLGARLLKKEAYLISRTASFSIFDDSDSLSLIKRVVKDLEFKPEHFKAPAIASKISKIKNVLLKPETILDENELTIFQAYENMLIKNNAFDFDDLIEKPVRLFENHPERLKIYQHLIRYLLVDEYQDINPAQYQLIKLLASGSRNLSVVGDDAQAIYGWRYADFRSFLDFGNDWPGAKIIKLEQNYRSTGNIITAASAIIKNNKFQKPKNLWTENLPGELIKVAAVGDPGEEADFIADRIKELMSYGLRPTVEQLNGYGLRPTVERLNGKLINSQTVATRNSSTIAVLYRTNAQSRALEQALIQNQIPYRIFGGLKFYERKEIKDIVAALRLIFNPKDQVSWERLAKTFPKSVSANLLKKLSEVKKELGILESINFFLKTANYFDYLEKQFPNARERIENINELIAFASEFSAKGGSLPAGRQGASGGKILGEFLERVSLLQSTDVPVKQLNGYGLRPTVERLNGKLINSQTVATRNSSIVQLMTIHLAKGLEFDSVFVAGVNEGLLPHQMSYGSKEELEEERRLMYVAMTRAKKQLGLSFYNLPSRFLYEIPPELTEFVNLVSGQSQLPDEDTIYIE